MTYASKVLAQELQRAVKSREQQPAAVSPAPSVSPTLNYQVSKEAHRHLERLRQYREKAKHVRVGIY